MRKYQVIIIVISVIVIIGVIQSIADLYGRREILTGREDTLSALEEKRRDLEDKLKEVQSQEFIEKEAREKLGLVKPGETVVLIDTSVIPQNVRKDGKKQSDIPNWKQWRDVFF